jgi:hypothetical protein
MHPKQKQNQRGLESHLIKNEDENKSNATVEHPIHDQGHTHKKRYFPFFRLIRLALGPLLYTIYYDV